MQTPRSERGAADSLARLIGKAKASASTAPKQKLFDDLGHPLKPRARGPSRMARSGSPVHGRGAGGRRRGNDGARPPRPRPGDRARASGGPPGGYNRPGACLRVWTAPLQAKATVPHGGWLPWLAEHTTVGPRQAQNYMKLTRRRAEIEAANAQRDSPLPIRDAIALLASPRTGRHTIFDEILDLGGTIRSQGLDLPEGLPFENWAKIGELLGKLERGSDDLNAWVYVQASLYQYGEKLLADVERMEPRQAEIREAYESGHGWPDDTEGVIDGARAWIVRAELWRQALARYDLALANMRLGEAVRAKLEAQARIAWFEGARP
jgi:hypothetical protein